jgi:tRNA(fMet)-specific endonuclease VapC
MATRYLLDSDICIFAMKHRPPALLRRLDRSAPVSAISVIVYGELWFGRTVGSHGDAASANLAALLESIEVLSLPVEAGTHYGAVRAALESAGTPIGTNDTWIAAHALADNLTVVTNNEREFRRVAGLRVENWSR